VRAPRFSGPAWDEAARAEMLGLQFAARRAARTDAREEVVLLDGRRVGAITARLDGDGVHVLDLAIVPELRGRGIGSAALAEVVGDRAARVEVESANAGARRFYERLGFEPAGDDGVTLALRRAAVRPTR
jgi:ribosomal protein S18 acetylase RimI-like enzyme